jgi:hypothetical protein
MKGDIPLKKVEDVGVCIIPRMEQDDEEELWDVYLINFKSDPIKNVLITSTGYGEIDGEARKTSTLRYFIEEIGPMEATKVEPILKSLFHLTHEYWLSFNYEDFMYDKKYIFVQGSISTENFILVPILDLKGVLIK